jgi:two-component system, sensor histidine kinase RpfC
MTNSKTATLTAPLWARLANADRCELEQAHIRVLSAAGIATYAAVYVMTTHRSPADAGLLPFVSSYLAAAIVIVLAIWALPAKSVTRRILGIFADVSAATWGIWVMGEGGAVIVGVYLFFILGNGFRYGRLYLHVTQALSIVGFAVVILSGSWWKEHMSAAVGFFYILLVIPFYVGVLAERMKAALLDAQQALEECRRGQVGGASEQSSEASGG